LIFTDASHRGGGHHQIPGCLEDSRGAELLPKSDIEFPPGGAPAHQTAHHHAFRHTSPIIALTGPKSG
jgi:hypothetical protein